MLETLLVYAIFMAVDMVSLSEYNLHLDELFLQNLNDDLLLDLQYCSRDMGKSIKLITVFCRSSTDFNWDTFGRLFVEKLESAYYKYGLNIRNYGNKAYSIWQILPSDIQMKEPFSILCYADDPLSYNDEKRSREFYQEIFRYYGGERLDQDICKNI